MAKTKTVKITALITVKGKRAKTLVNCSRVDLMAQLVARCSLCGARPFSAVAKTVPQMIKTIGDFSIKPFWWDAWKAGRITKVSGFGGFISNDFNFTDAVNRSLVKQGKTADFKPKERAWNLRPIDGTPFGWYVPTNEENLFAGDACLYVILMKRQVNWVKYLIDGQELSTVEDRVVSNKSLNAMFTEHEKPSSDTEGVQYRPYKMSSITEWSMDNFIWVIND